jgi:hypothetical protein
MAQAMGQGSQVSLEKMILGTLHQSAGMRAALQYAGTKEGSNLGGLLKDEDRGVVVNMDVLARTGGAGQISLNALFQGVQVQTGINLDARLRLVAQSEFLAADALLRYITTNTVSLDVWITGAHMRQETAVDAMVMALERSGASSVDARLRTRHDIIAAIRGTIQLLGAAVASQVDSMVMRQGLFSSLDTDAMAMRGRQSSSEVRAALQAISASAATAADSVLRGVGLARSASVNADLAVLGSTIGAAVSAIVKDYDIVLPVGFGGILQDTFTLPAGLNSILWWVAVLPVVTDACLQQGFVSGTEFQGLKQQQDILATAAFSTAIQLTTERHMELIATLWGSFDTSLNFSALVYSSLEHQPEYMIVRYPDKQLRVASDTKIPAVTYQREIKTIRQ